MTTDAREAPFTIALPALFLLDRASPPVDDLLAKGDFTVTLSRSTWCARGPHEDITLVDIPNNRFIPLRIIKVEGRTSRLPTVRVTVRVFKPTDLRTGLQE